MQRHFPDVNWTEHERLGSSLEEARKLVGSKAKDRLQWKEKVALYMFVTGTTATQVRLAELGLIDRGDVCVACVAKGRTILLIGLAAAMPLPSLLLRATAI